jgi:glutathione peroxidase
MSIYDITLKSSEGKVIALNTFKNKVLLVVNVTNYFGETVQHKKLEHLYKKYRDFGFEILGIVSDDFKPHAEAKPTEIIYSFPITEKMTVKGPNQHQLYKILTTEAPESLGQFYSLAKKAFVSTGIEPGGQNDVMWNFEKFLVSKSGVVKARYATDIHPDDPRLLLQIEESFTTP